MKPLARQDGLLFRKLPGELVVYDRRDHRAHCLNETAARVLEAADGTRTLGELADALDLSGSVAERKALVRLALDQLTAAGLLEAPCRPRSGSRRALLRRAATGAALLLPAVASIVAPTPAEACSAPACSVGSESQPCTCPNIAVPDCGVCQADGVTCALPGGGPC